MTATTSTMAPTSTQIVLDESPLPGSVVASDSLTWLRSRRERGLDVYNRRGIPTLRDEEWRFTSLRALTSAKLQLDRARRPSASIAPDNIPSLGIGPAWRLVFVDGVLRTELSDLAGQPGGVSVTPFTSASGDDEALLRATLLQSTVDGEDAFASLNLAAFDEGVLVHVRRGTVVDRPIVIEHVSTSEAAHRVFHPRNLIVVDREANVTVIEDYIGLDDESAYLSNAVTEIFVAENADAHHYMLVRESAAAFNVSTLQTTQARDSRLSSHSILLGGRITRNNVNPILNGENIHSVLNGLYIADGRQHMDNHMRVEHRKPHCDSRQYYRGILSDQSHGVFTGRIVVSQAAQKTDAVQSNQNLLLSADAQAQTRPQLEIYADDVKCTHGATIGEIDADALFYLLSRGVESTTAKALLVYAFASETLERMESAPVRDAVRELLLVKLPNSRSLRSVVS